jgi:hypothetical protein
MEQKVNGLQRITIKDESWFFLYHLSNSIWMASCDEFPQSTKQKIGTGKCLVSILWSVNGTQSLFDIPKGRTYNTAFFTDAAIPSLVENG